MTNHNIKPISQGNSEAANYLTVGVTTLRNSRHTGLLCGLPAPKFKKMGRKVIYLTKDLDEWLEALPSYQNTSEMGG